MFGGKEWVRGPKYLVNFLPLSFLVSARPSPGLIWVEAARLGKKTAKKAGPVIRGRAGPAIITGSDEQRGGEDGRGLRVRREVASAFCKAVGPPATAHGGPGGRGQIV